MPAYRIPTVLDGNEVVPPPDANALKVFARKYMGKKH